MFSSPLGVTHGVTPSGYNSIHMRLQRELPLRLACLRVVVVD